MAIISPIFGEMRGKLGGNVFSRNKGGPYVRMHAVPTNPNTERQQFVRNALATYAEAWESVLQDSNRANWNEWAQTHPWLNSLGQSIFLTGLDWFAMVNARCLDAGNAFVANPEDLTEPAPLATLVLSFTDADTISVAYTEPLAADERMQIWGSGPISTGRDPNFRACRLLGYSAKEAATPITFELPYAVPDGKKLKIFAARMSLQGRVSTYLADAAVYTAP